MSAFLATTLLGEVGDDGMNPKPNKKLSLGAESYGTIAWKGFFTQSQVLLSSIVGFSKIDITMTTINQNFEIDKRLILRDLDQLLKIQH